MIARLIEIDREIAAIRRAHEPVSSRSAAPEAEDGAAKEKGDGDRTFAVAIAEAAIDATRADTGASPGPTLIRPVTPMSDAPC